MVAQREDFKERYARGDRWISRMFATKRSCCAIDEDDMDMDELFGPSGQDNGGTPEPIAKPVATRNMDDDYDEFDEDEDEAPKPATPTPAPTNIPVTPNAQQDGSTKILEARERLEAESKDTEESVRDAMYKLFFTLENDRDALLEQQKLEESDRQVQAETNGQGTPGPQPTSHAPGKLSSTNLGASSLTLKHLIARIDAKRERVKLSDQELRQLLSDVRKNRSKWANEDKIGQEELYEAAEKVVLDLRAKTEHSTAFLNRVNKREAPHYFEIIKQPMDLGTVMKKLRGYVYKSKKEFVDDLDLIWENCLKYNSEPSHYLRKHAIAMRDAAKKLVQLVPDIVIRDRAEVEAEEAAAAEHDADGESDDEPIMSTRGRKAPKATKARKAARAESRAEATPEAKPPLLNLIRADSMPPNGGDNGSQFGDGSQIGLGTPPMGGTPAPNGHLGQLEIGEPKMDDETDPLMIAWKAMTKKKRADGVKRRGELFKENRIDPEQPALLRSRFGMGRFLRNEAKHRKGTDDSHDDAQHDKLADAEEDAQSAFFMPDYDDPMSYIPELPYLTEWRSGEGENVDAAITGEYGRIAPRGMFLPPSTGLNTKIMANLKQMQDTRKICSKITVIKQMQMQPQLYHPNQIPKYDPEPFKEVDAENFVVTEDGPIMDKDVNRAVLQRSVGKLFYHAGFEQFQPAALEVATDICADFFKNLGKTFKLYMESEEQYTKKAILYHTLFENGVETADLETYIREDVERLGSKLTTIQDRMKAHLGDMLRPAMQEGAGENIFEDGSEQFISGDFAADLNEDFLGLRDLGLDKELGLSSLSVPLHLLTSRITSMQNQTAGPAASVDGYTPPPPFEPLTAEVLALQIDLIKPYFEEKLVNLPADKNGAAIEDEDLPQRQRPNKPRLPPTGKITQSRKRVAGSQGGNSKKKKKPNPIEDKKAPPTKKERDESFGKGTEMDEGGMISPESIAA
ncbi:hypothetical protein BJ508DRAFT_212407 [Ascobolus immersus RN42]|uniref:SAGA complex subunit Spt7 n=1 Tax=Ascobolus immersus RN42 TaxID=1160509 RepID=A0A3N4HZS3_ASCIM|nr:hypothetical protein BJ508DRAFT_212407 [Ascobolus immersus RN42]